jgi:methyl acetate hydrolase
MKTQAIDAVLRQAVAAGEVPGVVAVAATDQGVIYEGAFGTREVGRDALMTPDTVGYIASMTKALTAAAAMQLVERGRLTRVLSARLHKPRRSSVGRPGIRSPIAGSRSLFEVNGCRQGAG